MGCYYTKKELYRIIGQIRSDLLLKTEQTVYPVPLLHICKQIEGLAVEAVPFRTKSLRGMAVIAENANHNDIILLNSHLDERELHFYCAHELVHICLHREEPGRQFSCYDKAMPHQDPALEWQANEGAAELLVPYHSLLPNIKRRMPSLHSAEAFRAFRTGLAVFYGVSGHVIRLRLESLKFEIQQHLEGCPVEKIELMSRRQQQNRHVDVKSLLDMEQELSCGMSPNNLHNSYSPSFL